jgi:hypothetical protein
VLEDIAFYLCSTLNGCIPRRNLKTVFVDGEIDILINNLNVGNLLSYKVLGEYFLVECKNYKQAVDVSRLGYFLYRMRLAHARFGILFATNDITGEGTDKNAESLRRRALHEDDAVCIVITGADLKALSEGKTNFGAIVFAKFEAFKFGLNPQN